MPITRHPGPLPVIPAHSRPGYRPFTRHTGYRPITRHPVPLPVIPAHYPPSLPFTRHSGESRNLAPPPYSTFPRSNGFSPQPPEKSAIFSDATSLRSAHKCGTLAISKSGNPAPGSNVPPKANPRRRSTRRPKPTGLQTQPGKKHREKQRAITRNRVQDNTAKTVGIATIVGSGTHSALFHGGVSGHAAGVPTALCRSSNGPGHGKLGHEILQAK